MTILICHLLPPLFLSFYYLSRSCLSLPPFLTLPLALYLLRTACASVGLQMITGVITHILDDLIGEKGPQIILAPPKSP